MTRSKGTTAYTAKMLVPLVIDQIIADRKTALKAVKALLAPYVRRDLGSSFVDRIIRLAKRQIHGNPVEEITKIKAQAAAFNNLGWKVTVATVPSESYATLQRAAAKKEHKALQLPKPEAERVAFGPSAVPVYEPGT